MATVLFRCDASPTIGAGHVMRCLAFAETLARFGWKAIFAVNRDAKTTVPALGASGHRLIEVTAACDPAIVADEESSVVVIDHYGYDATYESQLAGPERVTIVFDDLANRAHDCDILVDPTPGRTAADYAPYVPARCRMVLGPEFAIVRSTWREHRALTRARLSLGLPVERIVVSMGATDPINATSRVLDAIARSSFGGRIDVVLGAGAPYIQDVSKRRDERTVVHVEPDDLGEIVSSADLVIGAPGSSSFERAVLGLPTLMIPTADNQKFVAAAFSAREVAKVLPASILDDPSALAGEIDALTGDPGVRLEMSAAAAAITDGRGSLRLLAAIAGSVSVRGRVIRLRLAEEADELWLLDLQRQPATRRYARDPAVPDAQGHKIWFERVLNDPDRLLAIVVVDDAAVGMVRLDRLEERTFEVSIAIDQTCHRRGLGGAALTLLRRLASGADLVATIREENAASISMFATAGYEPCAEDRYLNRATS